MIIIHEEVKSTIYSSGTIDYILFYDREELFIALPSPAKSLPGLVGVVSKDFHSAIIARYSDLWEILGKVRWSIVTLRVSYKVYLHTILLTFFCKILWQIDIVSFSYFFLLLLNLFLLYVHVSQEDTVNLPHS
jgi:hypothetical protein